MQFDSSRLAVQVRLGAIDDSFRCSICECRMERDSFSPFHRFLDDTKRMCLNCRSLYWRKLYWNTRRTFAEEVDGEYSLFDAVADGNFAFVHDACRVDGSVDAGEVPKKLRAVNSHDHTTGRSVLHEAAANGDVDLCELLLECGANVNCRSLLSLETPLFTAVANDHVIVVMLLLASGANVDARDRFNGTAVHYAKSAVVVDVMVQMGGAPLDVVDRRGRDPLTVYRQHLACFKPVPPPVTAATARYLAMSGKKPSTATGAGGAGVGARAAGSGAKSGGSGGGSGAAAAAASTRRASSGTHDSDGSGAGDDAAAAAAAASSGPTDEEVMLTFLQRKLGEEKLANAIAAEQARLERERIDREYRLMLDMKRQMRSAEEMRGEWRGPAR